VDTLPRASEPGQELNFELNFIEAVEPARLLVDLYKRLLVTALEDFPDNFLTVVRDNANNHFQILPKHWNFQQHNRIHLM